MKLLTTIILAMGCSCAFAQTGVLSVTVTDNETKKGIPFAEVKIYKKRTLIQQATCDSLGNYEIVSMRPDTVNVQGEAETHRKNSRKDVVIRENKISFVNVSLNRK